MLHVVTEGEFHRRFLERLLGDLAPTCEFRIDFSEGPNAARPLAMKYLVDDPAPVAFVIDANSNGDEWIRNEQADYEAYFRWSALAPFKVVQFVPEIERVFFESVEPLERLLGRVLDPAMKIAGRYAPRKILEILYPGSPIHDRGELVERLTEADLAVLRTHSAVAALRGFIQKHAETIPSAEQLQSPRPARRRRASS